MQKPCNLCLAVGAALASLGASPVLAAYVLTYTFGAPQEDPTSVNGYAERPAVAQHTEAGVIDQTAKKATSPANALFTVADKDFTSPATFTADTNRAHLQKPLFSIDAYNLAAGKKSEDIARINVLSTDAAKKAQLVNTEAIEPAARLLQVLGGVEVTAVFAETDGSFDSVDVMIKELAGKGLVVFGAFDDGAVQGDKRVVLTSDDDAWTKAYGAMLGGNNFTLLADDEAAPDFDISGTYGKLATSGLGAARTQTAVFA